MPILLPCSQEQEVSLEMEEVKRTVRIVWLNSEGKKRLGHWTTSTQRQRLPALWS